MVSNKTKGRESTLESNAVTFWCQFPEGEKKKKDFTCQGPEPLNAKCLLDDEQKKKTPMGKLLNTVHVKQWA